MAPVITQEWFEMPDVRRRRFENAVWIPLYAHEQLHTSGTPYEAESAEDLFACGSVAIPISIRAEAESLRWSDIGLISTNSYAFRNGKYKTCDTYQHDEGKDLGVHLVVVQYVGAYEPNIHHLNLDLVVALGLVLEGDSWIRPQEDYTVVARRRWNKDGTIAAIEIRAEFLKDYLAARNLTLRLATYRHRHVTMSHPPPVSWPEDEWHDTKEHDRFEARRYPVDAEGGPFGGGVAVFSAWRTDVDPDEDVPVFGPESDSNTGGSSRTFKREGPKYFRIEGELWREEWIEPAARSERIRGDAAAETFSYIVDAAGTRSSDRELDSEDIGRYLWFSSRVIPALANRRGGTLQMFSAEMGRVACSPGCVTTFGLNKTSLVTVHAYDVAKLPAWQQRIWHGHNVSPDGGVSTELLNAQMRVIPARTRAVEKRFAEVVEGLNMLFVRGTGQPLFRPHDSDQKLLNSVHRFRAVESGGILALAKDIARVVTDRIDVQHLRKLVPGPDAAKLASLKLLERLVEAFTSPEHARRVMRPLFGIYELRLADAHLPSNELLSALEKIGVDATAHEVEQGRQVIEGAFLALHEIFESLVKDGSQSTPSPAELPG